jgi:glutamine amidotransferase-like uncharacterized protein
MSKPIIFVYSDKGAHPLAIQETITLCEEILSPRYQTKTIDCNRILSNNWEKEAALLIFPGGRDVPYDRLLKGAGTQRIRSFVQNGGSYLGICAGAYFGTNEVIFNKGTPLEVLEKRELKFFPGASIGPLFLHRHFVYDSLQGAYAALLSFQNKTFPILYNGGCYFKNAHRFSKTVTILGYYQEDGDKAAIVLCNIGKGKAILSGVHFEFCAFYLENRPHPHDILDKLKSAEPERLFLAKTLFQMLELL